MVDFRTKKRIRKILYSKVMVLLLAVLFVLSVRGAWDMYDARRYLKKKLSGSKLPRALRKRYEKNLVLYAPERRW